VTLLLLGQRPYRLSADEGDAWIREQASRLLDLPGIAAAHFVPLQKASWRHEKPFEWLVEFDVDTGAVEALVASPMMDELLAELRSLGMVPSLFLADRTSEPGLTPAR